MGYRIGDIIRILDCPDARQNNGLTGTILYKDRDYLYGSWSDEILYPYENYDIIEVIGHTKVSEKTVILMEMSSNQNKAEVRFEGGLNEGIIHLIKLYCYRDWEAVKSYKWDNEWINTISNNIASHNKLKDSDLTEKSFDSVVAEYMDDFDFMYESAKEECKDYSLKISDKDKAKVKKFVKEYLEWAKPYLLEKTKIMKPQVKTQIYKMLGWS